MARDKGTILQLQGAAAALPRLQGAAAVLVVDFDRVAEHLAPTLLALLVENSDGVDLRSQVPGFVAQGLKALGFDIDAFAPVVESALQQQGLQMRRQIVNGRPVLDVQIALDAANPVNFLAASPIAPLVDSDWTFVLSGEATFRQLIANGFNALSDHIKLDAVAPGEAPASGDSSATNWFLRSQNRILFQGTIQWGDTPPVSRLHEQLGFELHSGEDGRLTVRQTHSRGSNIQIDIQLSQSFGLEVVPAAGRPGLRLKGSDVQLAGNGIAEETLMTIARGLFGSEFREGLEAVSLSAATNLLTQYLGAIGKAPLITSGGLFGQMVLAGHLG